MSTRVEPSGHVQVKPDKNGKTRSFWAFWTDAAGKRQGRTLGPAHVKDTGRRTARGAPIWRAGDGPKPTPRHLAPKDAEAKLTEILDDARHADESAPENQTLRLLAEGWIEERTRERGLKRGTTSVYGDMFERMYRDLGEDIHPSKLTTEDLRSYFGSLEAQEQVGPKRAAELRAAGANVKEIVVARWTAQPADSRSIEVSTKAEAVRVAAEVDGKWKHEARGVYRITPAGAQRPRRVRRDEAKKLEAEGWVVERRTATRWAVCSPAAAQTRNKYRDVLSAILDYGVRIRAIKSNPMDEVPRASLKAVRRAVLRRDDFYDPQKVDRLLQHAPSTFEEAFWLCGFHAGARLPGEGLGLRWGAVDFDAGVIRIIDNWVENALDTTKTDDTVAVPMTPRLLAVLADLKRRSFCTADDDFVFTRDELGHPTSESALRDAFKTAQAAAGLKPIPMYNARHSFGTALARAGLDVRTIQALMRHTRLSTTEQYMAYSPQPELARRIADALELPQVPVAAESTPSPQAIARLIDALQDELPPKWLREVERVAGQLTANVHLAVAA